MQPNSGCRAAGYKPPTESQYWHSRIDQYVLGLSPDELCSTSEADNVNLLYTTEHKDSSVSAFIKIEIYADTRATTVNIYILQPAIDELMDATSGDIRLSFGERGNPY